MTPDDLPNEFYIVLGGEVGIFPPRLDEYVARESKSIERIKALLKVPADQQLTISGDAVYGNADVGKLENEDRDFLAQILKFEKDKVTFKLGYLQRKLGVMPEDTYELPDFYHYVGPV